MRIKMSNINLLSESYSSILEKISEASSKRLETRKNPPILVAASKLKPVENIINLYKLGHKHFGENYLQELIEKSNDPKLKENCQEIKWHFIGHLQTNKIPKIFEVPNLHLLETIDSVKAADMLQKQCNKHNLSEPLKIMVQVNTSNEENKSGCNPQETVSLVNHIIRNCPSISFTGLMTIGLFDHDLSKGPNPDFLLMGDLRKKTCSELNLTQNQVLLSMGMSNDFEHAIELGSDVVRVGTALFGARHYPDKK